MIFDVDITAKLFFWESRNDFRKEVYKKSLGDGLYIIGENVLVVTGGLEIREAGSHSAHLKCIDEDGTHTIYKWEITVKPKKV